MFREQKKLKRKYNWACCAKHAHREENRDVNRKWRRTRNLLLKEMLNDRNFEKTIYDWG
jgi:hypothetical protein